MLKCGDRGLLFKAVVPRGGDSTTPIVKFAFCPLPRDISQELIPLGKLDDGSHMDGFLKCLELLEIHVEEANCAEIMGVFDFMQPRKKVLWGFDALSFRDVGGPEAKAEKENAQDEIDELVYVRRGKEDAARAYREVIYPPKFEVEGGCRWIRFWMADLSTGDLEQWGISEDNEGERRIEGKVVEADLLV